MQFKPSKSTTNLKNNPGSLVEPKNLIYLVGLGFEDAKMSLKSFFRPTTILCTYYNNDVDLFEALGHVYKPEQWNLFNIGFSKIGLKALLLHSSNTYLYVPLACSNHKKETRLKITIKLLC